jgi:nicotinate-nucleotide pyrophosphorylase (carboxylating)
VLAGLPAAQLVVDEMHLDADAVTLAEDGAAVTKGMCVMRLSGATRDLLTAERLILNLLARLSGIATLTHRFVRQLAGTSARLYDTRKTTPGWRRLEKYAVRCGGGHNHRVGLFDAVLIKDNHLAQAASQQKSPREAVEQARRFLAAHLPDAGSPIIEVEVDTLDQLDQALAAQPDIILLDNMTPAELCAAVHRRDLAGSQTQLEASGGVTLESIRAVAETGVDRISAGAVTHSAINLDFGLDWQARAES